VCFRVCWGQRGWVAGTTRCADVNSGGCCLCDQPTLMPCLFSCRLLLLLLLLPLAAAAACCCRFCRVVTTTIAVAATAVLMRSLSLTLTLLPCWRLMLWG
jgi:hypothetical protein